MSVDSRRRTGRPPNVVPTTAWKIHIPIPLAAKVELLLLDPVTNEIRHGARGAYISALIVRDLAQRGVVVDLPGIHPESLKQG